MSLPRIARVECDGFDYSVFATGDFLSQQVLRNGTWGKLQHGLSGLLMRGFEAPVVVDVGANFGLYAIPVAAMAAQAGGRLFAFEPQRIIFQQLCANIFANRLERVWAFNQAVGASAGEIEIPAFDYGKTANIGAFSIDKDLQKMRGLEAGVDRENGEVVAMTTLDLLQVQGTVRCVKIDVEGMEIDVVRGGRNFLENHRFPPLIFEAWEGDWFTEKRNALFTEVTGLGYEVTKLARDEFLAQHPDNEARVSVHIDGNRIDLNRLR
jgi:FkbM family methyltransferase